MLIENNLMRKQTDHLTITKRGNTAILLLATQGLIGCGGGSSSVSYQIQTLLGTAGNDLLVSSTDYGIIDALAGNDRIYGTEQAEVILPGFGSDEVFASGGADTITVVSFNDEIDGGTGSDTLSVEFANTNIEVIISLADGLIYNAQAAAIDRSTLSSIENVEINSDNSVTVFGTDTDNQITTASGNDTIHLGGGSNVVNSGAGSDHIYIAGSGNTANLGSGNDFVTTSSFDSAIDGGTGIDTLILSPNSFGTPLTINLELQTFTSTAASGSINISNIEQYEFSETITTTVHGTEAAEAFILSSGAGIIYGGGGGDTFTGSALSDKFVFSQKYENSDTITNFTTSGANLDIVAFNQANFGLSGSTYQEISLFSGGRKEITADVGFIFVQDQIGFSSETALSTALSGINGITTSGSSLGSVLCMWWQPNSSSAVMSVITDFTPNNNSFDQIENIAVFENLTAGDYSNFSNSNIEVL